MRYLLVALCVLLGPVTAANAQLNISIGIPGISIGINLGEYPELVQVPDYPVYYSPRSNINLFFYDGMYWAYQREEWYASSWYNGPWGMVDRMFVPFYVLRIPVRYYRAPPQYFRGWRQDAPPRWGDHWGNQWQERRRGWDQWDRKSVPPPAPMPVYQRQYSGDRYPRVEQQRELHNQNYRYQPREAVVQEHYKEQAVQRPPEAAQRREQGASQERGGRQESQRSNPTPPPQAGAPAPRSQPQQGSDQREQPVQKGADGTRGPTPAPQQSATDKDQSRQPQQGASQRAQQSPRANPQNKGAAKDSRGRQEQDKDRDKEDEKGPDRNR